MKWVCKSLVLLALVILLAGCSEQSAEKDKGELIRVDVQQVDKNGTKSV